VRCVLEIVNVAAQTEDVNATVNADAIADVTDVAADKTDVIVADVTDANATDAIVADAIIVIAADATVVDVIMIHFHAFGHCYSYSVADAKKLNK